MDNTEKKGGDEMVSVKKSELEAVLNRVKALEDNSTAPVAKPKEVKVRNVTIFFIDNQPVIGYANRGTPERPIYVYDRQDPNRPTEYISYIDVIVRGKDKPLNLNYNEFMQQCDRRECPIVAKHDDEWSIDQGTVEAKVYQDGTYHMNTTGAVIPVEVKGKISTYTVQLPDGTTADFHERYVNINK